MKDYKDYLKEIEELKLSAMQKLLLQIAASFKVNKTNYDKLKEEFTKK